MIKSDNFFKMDKDIELSLKQEFIKALKDEKFTKLVNKLDVSEDILMKYTSRLQDCSLECNNCRGCKGLSECKNKVRGFVLTPIKNKNTINFSYIGCNYTKKEEYKDNVVLFDVSKEIKNASLSSIYTDDINRVEILKKIKSYYTNYFTDTKDKGIYLYGSFGTGKTYLISALFNELAKKGIRSALIYYPEFLRSLKASFETNYAEQFNYIKKVPLLLFDDIGAENCTNWSRDEVLGPILQYRMEEHLPTFFTSNLTLDELEVHLSIVKNSVDKVKARRIIERIKYLTDNIIMIAENRRK